MRALFSLLLLLWTVGLIFVALFCVFAMADGGHTALVAGGVGLGYLLLGAVLFKGTGRSLKAQSATA